MMIEDFVNLHVKRSDCALPLQTNNLMGGRFLLHGHCHQKALWGTQGTTELLGRLPGVDVDALDSACCGMAGMFGFEREHYEISNSIADLSLFQLIREDAKATVLAPGTSCRHQIRDGLGKEALHPIEVVAKAFGMDEQT
jgi:Fe-S oxidoreductase